MSPGFGLPVELPQQSMRMGRSDEPLGAFLTATGSGLLGSKDRDQGEVTSLAFCAPGAGLLSSKI